MIVVLEISIFCSFSENFAGILYNICDLILGDIPNRVGGGGSLAPGGGQASTGGQTKRGGLQLPYGTPYLLSTGTFLTTVLF